MLQHLKKQADTNDNHYILRDYYPKPLRSCCRQFYSRKVKSDLEGFQEIQHQGGFILANDSRIQFYQSLSQETNQICYHSQMSFFCSIRVMEVIPSKHHDSDFIFIGDQNGRYAVIHQNQGVVYKNQQFEGQLKLFDCLDTQQQFSGVTYSYNVNDTQGYISYVVCKILITIHFIVKKGGFTIVKVLKTPISYNQFRYFNALSISNKNKHLIGFVQQFEQKTNLNILQAKNPTKHDFTISKMNILQFVGGNGNNNELAVLTLNEATVYRYNGNSCQAICSFRLHENGYHRICLVSQQRYICFGNEVVLFSKAGYKNYGEFVLGNQYEQNYTQNSFIQCNVAKADSNVFFLLDTHGSVYFIQIKETGYQIIKQIKGLGPIFIMKKDSSTNKMLTVNEIGENTYAVKLSTNKSPIRIFEDQSYKGKLIDKTFSTNQGRILVICAGQQNIVMRFDEKTHNFIQSFTLPNQSLLLAIDEYIVMQSGIYGVNYISNTYSKISISNIKTPIIEAQYDQQSQQIAIQDEDKTIWVFRINQQKCIEKKKQDQNLGLWKIYANCLVYSSLNQLGVLYVDGFKGMPTIKIDCQTQQLITDILVIPSFKIKANMQELNQLKILIGFGHGYACYVTLNSKKHEISHQFIGFEPVQLSILGTSIVCRSGETATFFNINQQFCYLSGIDIPEQYTTLLYLEKQNKILLINNRKFCLSDELKKQKTSMLSSSDILALSSDVPYCQIDQHNIYVAISQLLSVYDSRTKSLLKKQFHSLKEVTGIEKINTGIVLIGTDSLDNGCVFLFHKKTLQIIHNFSIGHKKIPYAIKKIIDKDYQSQLVVRYDTYISLLKINSMCIQQILSFNTNFDGSSLDAIQQKILINDPIRYVALYSLHNGSIVPLARHMRQHMITDIGFCQESIVYGDRGGYVGILQTNFQNSNDIQKMTLSEVAQIYIGQQIFTIIRDRSSIYFGCREGHIGKIQTLSNGNFKLLKTIELEVLRSDIAKKKLSYIKWRRRHDLNDKIIDEALIRFYLQQKQYFESKNQSLYNKTKAVATEILDRDM